MSDQIITLQLEIPPEVAKQDVWNLEEQCKQVVGVVKTSLRQPKDPVTATLLIISIVVTVAGEINTIHDLVQNIYDFLHPKKQEADRQQGKQKVVIIKPDGTRIEIYDLPSKEIEKIIHL